MRVTGKITRTHAAAALGALLAALCGLLLDQFNFGKSLAESSFDLLTMARGDRPVNEAVLVYMDEPAHRELNQVSTAAWDRALHAKLIDRLTAAGARAIVFDVVFANPNPEQPAADEALAQSIKKNGHVILAADYARSGPNVNKGIPPFELVRAAAADMGSDEVQPDADIVVRQHTHRYDSPISSLSWVAASLVKAPVTRNEALEDLPRWMNYYGPPLFLPWKSYHEALDPALVPDEFFRGKVVFVGARVQTRYAGDRKDEYRNPFSFWDDVKRLALYSPGVEVQATAFINLVRGDWLNRLGPSLETGILIVLGLVLGYGLVLLTPVRATIVALAALALLLTVSFLIFSRQRTWFPFLIIVVQCGLGLFWSILFNSVQLYVEKRLYEETLRLYLPPKLVKKFARNRDLLKHGGKNETLTLLFSDIANFTTVTEGMNPQELEVMMRDYFQGAVSECIHKADGTVSKFIGDAIFTFWNAPDAQEDHALLGCQAALLFRQKAEQPIHGRLLVTRIGLHTGEASVGNFGSADRYDYTALGENVNLASRLEGLNKYLGTQCLISGATKARIGERLVTRGLGKFQLKGFEGLVEVHELVGWPEEADATRAWRDAFEEALSNYEQRNLEFAEMGFRRVLEIKPEDGPSKFYLTRIEELSRQELPDNWVTHTILKEK